MEAERKQITCPKCAKENPADARFCNACGASLMQASEAGGMPDVRLSKLAIASFVGAVFGPMLLMPVLIGMSLPRSPFARSEWVGPVFLAGVVVLGITATMGLVSIIRIERSGGRITGRPFAIAAALAWIFGAFLMVIWPVMVRPRSTAYRMVCGGNLSGLGKAMLIYANDYDEQYPRAGGKNSVWAAKTPNWQAANRYEAFGLNADATGGQASISASLYLLVKYAQAKPKQFVCTKDSGTEEFKLGWLMAPDKKLTDLWDFGPEPVKHCSYSYHNPYGPYPLSTDCNPGLAVAAERNPWMPSPFAKPRDFARFNPDGDRDAIKAGNALAHTCDGQNVLFVDNHASFEKNSFCAFNDDNIYTSWNGQDNRRGTPPILGSQPADRLDSLLVNDPPVPR